MNTRPIRHDALVGMMRDAGVELVDHNPPRPFNAAALYAAVNEKRRPLDISFNQVAKLTTIRSASTFTRLKHDLGIDADNLVRIMRWLDITDLGPFMR